MRDLPVRLALLVAVLLAPAGCGPADPPADAPPGRSADETAAPATAPDAAPAAATGDPDVLARTVREMEAGLDAATRERFDDAVDVLKLDALLAAGFAGTVVDAVGAGKDVAPPDTAAAYEAVAARVRALGVQGTIAEGERREADVVRRMGEAAGDAASEALRRVFGGE